MKRIESTSNQKVKQWKKLHTKKEREKTGLFIIEGVHLIEEALKSDLEIDTILADENFVFPPEWQAHNLDITYVTNAVLKEVSETLTPQGIIAVCRQLETADVDIQGGKYLLIDGVQDPGNVGTMIRTADAAGLTAVILGEGTVDVYNSKVIRATQGSLFHIPVYKGVLPEWIAACKQNNVPVFGTALEHASTYTAIEPQTDFALIVGNEGEGVSRGILEQTDQNLYVPLFGKAESLNVGVATGILLYYLRGA
ncbi:TrmH family RNA methyltransferase [Bacillus alkalicellulosilyticus]|uniref:TrmH family RNA methyltransferase n=1 Tax=Alkalihalobacterium alkalicellulosilyticum TaxID=1912214 RepID=UPI00099663AB|nr:RNA methyltransferase [Bacillus alkalicellulosilyticus]